MHEGKISTRNIWGQMPPFQLGAVSAKKSQQVAHISSCLDTENGGFTAYGFSVSIVYLKAYSTCVSYFQKLFAADLRCSQVRCSSVWFTAVWASCLHCDLGFPYADSAEAPTLSEENLFLKLSQEYPVSMFLQRTI